MTASPKFDIYQTITARIIAALESNPGKLEMPWHSSRAPLMRPVASWTTSTKKTIP